MTPKGVYVTAPGQFYNTSQDRNEVFLALRSLFSLHRETVAYGAGTLADLLYERRLLLHRPDVFDVEVALEALRTEGQVLG